MSHYTKVLVIANPAAGQSLAEKIAGLLDETLTGNGATVTSRFTRNGDDASDWAGRAAEEGFDLVVAVGGDGTVAQVVEGMLRANSPVPLGIIPTGTANLLARAAAIPNDVEKALEVLRVGRPVEFDVGVLPEKGRHFLISAAIGHPARIIKLAPREMKDRLGFFAYIWAAVRDLGRLRNVRMDLETDTVPRVVWAHSLLVMNIGDFRAFGLSLGPGVTPHDGRLQIGAVRTRSFLEYVSMLVALLRRKFRESPHLTYFDARSVVIRTRRPAMVQIDGELVGETPVRIELLASAIKLVVPADYDSGAPPPERTAKPSTP